MEKSGKVPCVLLSAAASCLPWGAGMGEAGIQCMCMKVSVGAGGWRGVGGGRAKQGEG